MRRILTVLVALASASVPAACAGQDDHTHGGFDIPAGEPVPEIELVVDPDPVSGWNVQLITGNFTFAPQRAGREFVLGEGHAHLYVDGRKVARLYGPWFHLGDLEAGPHTLEVTLNANDHAVYQAGGEPIGATIGIEAEPADHAHSADLPVPADGAMTVSLRMEEDPVSGWNLFLDTTGLQWAPQHAGGSHVPGEGHAHLLVDGRKVARLYGPAYHLDSLTAGRHEVSVGLYANDHRPYTAEGEPVVSAVQVDVSGQPDRVDRAIALVVRAGRVQGGAQRIEVDRGDVVSIAVNADEPGTAHLHGYDATVPVGPGSDGTLTFTASIPGIFEVELEETGVLLLELVVG